MSSLFDEETVGISASFRPARRKSVIGSQIVKKVQRVRYAKMVRVAVFRIHDVLIRILIRIQGYVALNYGSGSLLFSSVDFKMPTKNLMAPWRVYRPVVADSYYFDE